ncbi:MAG: hypothetical protein H8F28_02995 [Fibrella sp.]|nr:hypothetical protein [Armatimonadota bacterium]
MPAHTPNPFPTEHPASAIYDTLTAERSGDAPLLPKQIYRAGLQQAIGDLHRAGNVSYNVAALLHLMNDDLDAAHVLSQAHEDDATANYVHQIVHRREGDFGNTRYWVMKTGPHPFYAELASLAQTAGQTEWSANEMVTWATRGEHFAPRLSDAETQALLAWCLRSGQ